MWINCGVGWLVGVACTMYIVQQVSNSDVGGRFCEVIGTSVLADPIISKSIQPCFYLYPACLHTNYAIKWPLCALLNTLLLWPSKMQYYQWCYVPAVYDTHHGDCY